MSERNKKKKKKTSRKKSRLPRRVTSVKSSWIIFTKNTFVFGGFCASALRQFVGDRWRARSKFFFRGGVRGPATTRNPSSVVWRQAIMHAAATPLETRSIFIASRRPSARPYRRGSRGPAAKSAWRNATTCAILYHILPSRSSAQCCCCRAMCVQDVTDPEGPEPGTRILLLDDFLSGRLPVKLYRETACVFRLSTAVTRAPIKTIQPQHENCRLRDGYIRCVWILVGCTQGRRIRRELRSILKMWRGLSKSCYDFRVLFLVEQFSVRTSELGKICGSRVPKPTIWCSVLKRQFSRLKKLFGWNTSYFCVS